MGFGNGSVQMYLMVCLVMLISSTYAWAADATTQPAKARRVPLWKTAPGLVAGKDAEDSPLIPTLDIYPLPGEGDQAAQVTRDPAMIVLPGGGYTHLSMTREGSDVAQLLSLHHLKSFVLRYRHAPLYAYPAPFLDVQRAVRYVRAHADELGVNPNRIGILGFSAGGHLASTLITHFDAGDPAAPDPIDRFSCRPDFAALMYAVITFTDESFVHKGSRKSLAGSDTSLWELLSNEKHVTKDTPPTFLFSTDQDTTVPSENSVLFYLACREAHVPAELHVFQPGRHGVGLATANPALKVWPDLLIQWLNQNHVGATTEPSKTEN